MKEREKVLKKEITRQESMQVVVKLEELVLLMKGGKQLLMALKLEMKGNAVGSRQY